MNLLPISRLRLWLQSASLLAVLAGYGVMLGFNQVLSGYERDQAHRQLAEEVASQLSQQTGSRQQLRQLLLARSRAPLLQLRLTPLPAGPAPAGPLRGEPRLVSSGAQSWLVSRVAIPLSSGETVWLQVEQNVSASVRQQQLGSWLLLVAAGLASLITSGLLRLVLWRGLSQPLEVFRVQLSGIEAPPRPGDQLVVADQPEELRPIARAFNALQQRLAASWERQRSFVDGVAHELRTPITLVSGHAQRLLRRHPDPALVPSLRLIQQESARMGTLVADLLDLARQDSGRLRLRCRPIQADDVLLALHERLALGAAGRLRLAGSDASGEPGPPPALADPDRLQQCLTALVDNALLYSPPGSPVTVGAAGAADGRLLLWVRDHGPGVEEAERERIFGRFVRGSAGLRGDQRGSGIGLAVVKLLMEAMGGDVRVVEAPGGGAEFQLRLPALEPALEPGLSPAADPPSA
ncbi:sensor histidine kinase KdpD [Cyanobium sp. NIES-981]|uniref:sensor histidine kinase n=1 Tax=Cyanobium sp. NIES-981 TaxID=1851505 RepID=UPI0007DCFFB6|nr:HAMP domain-containing sensor histidine kinase [Cyanobium sp. NIES-981]SBO43200.1 Two-component sensor histidine kinase [Cyanobium sp. NIES-981]